jgi:hypothetical protein
MGIRRAEVTSRSALAEARTFGRGWRLGEGRVGDEGRSVRERWRHRVGRGDFAICSG